MSHVFFATSDLITRLQDVASRSMIDIGKFDLAVIMSASLACSFFITLLYKFFFERRGTGSRIHRSFPLLGMSITAIFVSIQFSLPLSLGLLGALSIVRFRTPIKEPEEMGFIMLVVATSLCCATFNILFAVGILAIAVAALIVMHLGTAASKRRRAHGSILVTIPTADYLKAKNELFEILKAVDPSTTLRAITEDGEETRLSFDAEKSSTGGVMGVREALARISNKVTVNAYFAQKLDV